MFLRDKRRIGIEKNCDDVILLSSLLPLFPPFLMLLLCLGQMMLICFLLSSLPSDLDLGVFSGYLVFFLALVLLLMVSSLRKKVVVGCSFIL